MSEPVISSKDVEVTSALKKAAKFIGEVTAKTVGGLATGAALVGGAGIATKLAVAADTYSSLGHLDMPSLAVPSAIAVGFSVVAAAAFTLADGKTEGPVALLKKLGGSIVDAAKKIGRDTGLLNEGESPTAKVLSSEPAKESFMSTYLDKVTAIIGTSAITSGALGLGTAALCLQGQGKYAMMSLSSFAIAAGFTALSKTKTACDVIEKGHKVLNEIFGEDKKAPDDPALGR